MTVFNPLDSPLQRDMDSREWADLLIDGELEGSYFVDIGSGESLCRLNVSIVSVDFAQTVVEVFVDGCQPKTFRTTEVYTDDQLKPFLFRLAEQYWQEERGSLGSSTLSASDLG